MRPSSGIRNSARPVTVWTAGTAQHSSDSKPNWQRRASRRRRSRREAIEPVRHDENERARHHHLAIPFPILLPGQGEPWKATLQCDVGKDFSHAERKINVRGGDTPPQSRGGCTNYAALRAVAAGASRIASVPLLSRWAGRGCANGRRSFAMATNRSPATAWGR